jgi:TctA family transporter
MDLLDNLALGFTTASTLYNISFCLIGVLLGTLIGVLPGIGATATIAMLLPITFQIGDPVSSLIMLAGIYYGAQYGGSTTAILINMPGESSSAVTAIDGYQMARNGPGRCGACDGGDRLFRRRHHRDSADRPVRATADGDGAEVRRGRIHVAHGSRPGHGRRACPWFGRQGRRHGHSRTDPGLVGIDVISGTPRLNFGLMQLGDQLNFVALAVGLFGIAEILRNLEDERTREVLMTKVTGLMPTREDFRRMAMPILRGTGLGSILGILPGNGAVLAAFASYTIEKRLSDRPQEFGKGALAGVAGPESATMPARRHRSSRC